MNEEDLDKAGYAILVNLEKDSFGFNFFNPENESDHLSVYFSREGFKRLLENATMCLEGSKELSTNK
jgi:hypothetical protein